MRKSPVTEIASRLLLQCPACNYLLLHQTLNAQPAKFFAGYLLKIFLFHSSLALADQATDEVFWVV